MTTDRSDQPPDPSTQDLLFHLLGTAHALDKRVEDALARLGRTTLTVLDDLVTASDPPSAGDLAAPESVIERLEQDGLVRRMPAAGLRVVRVVITAKGRARHRAALERLNAVRVSLTQGLDAAALERALAALR